MNRSPDKCLKEMSPKSRDFILPQDSLLMQAHQVEHLVERVLLPLQILALHLRVLVLSRRQPPLLEGEWQDVLAE